MKSFPVTTTLLPDFFAASIFGFGSFANEFVARANIVFTPTSGVQQAASDRTRLFGAVFVGTGRLLSQSDTA
jgi:hypothetical protein